MTVTKFWHVTEFSLSFNWATATAAVNVGSCSTIRWLLLIVGKFATKSENAVSKNFARQIVFAIKLDNWHARPNRVGFASGACPAPANGNLNGCHSAISCKAMLIISRQPEAFSCKKLTVSLTVDRCRNCIKTVECRAWSCPFAWGHTKFCILQSNWICRATEINAKSNRLQNFCSQREIKLHDRKYAMNYMSAKMWKSKTWLLRSNKSKCISNIYTCIYINTNRKCTTGKI